MKLLVFGAGNIYRQMKYRLAGYEILAILDNSQELQGKVVDGILVDSPLNTNEYNYDKICILNSYVRETFNQLLSLGVPQEKILFTFDLIAINNKFQYEYTVNNDCVNPKGKRVTLISHDFSITGAPNCLLLVAKCLLEGGYMVTVASPTDGAMRALFEEIGANVIVDERLLISRGSTIEWMNKCDVLFVNTVQLYYLLAQRTTNIRTVWWLHEPPSLYKYVLPDMVQRISLNNLNIYAVSDVARNAFVNVRPDAKVKLMIYGLPDKGGVHLLNKQRFETKFRFAIIGEISKLKGHDILVEAILCLQSQIREKCEFICIGENKNKYGIFIQEQALKMKLPMQFYGVKSHDETLDILANANGLICASREESMSVAVTESLMQSHPVIIPDGIGNTRYIKDRYNGLIYRQNDSESLAKCIEYCVSNYQICREIGKRGRRTFEEIFSFDTFKKNIVECIEKSLLN